MDTVAERFDVSSGTRKKFEPTSVELQDAGRWAGLRLEQWAGNSSDLPETVLFQHGLCVSFAADTSSEIYWSGHGRVRGQLLSRQLLLCPAAMPYEVQATGYWRGVAVALDPSFLQATISLDINRPVELLPKFGVSDEFLFQAVSALVNDIALGYPSGSLYGESIAATVAVHLARHYSTGANLESRLPEVSRLRKERVREFMLDQMHQSITLKTMADFAAMDVYAFARWFKRAFGVPPHQFLQNARINRAKGLLATTSISVVDIALQCGFYSQSHLANSFRRIVGVPPRIYRQSIQGRR